MTNCKIVLTSIFIYILLLSCSQGNNSVNEDSADQKVDHVEAVEEAEKTNEDSTIVEAVLNAPPPPPTSPKKDSIVKVFSKKSPFLNLGCCNANKNREKECCCLKVLEEYEKMVNSKDKNLAKYKTTDPILGTCRRKMVSEFDNIDNPPSAVKSDDNFDDLF